jgi:hypothetical protein
MRGGWEDEEAKLSGVEWSGLDWGRRREEVNGGDATNIQTGRHAGREMKTALLHVKPNQAKQKQK